MSDGNLWERQSGETAKAFHAFEHLRTLSALGRSIPAARAACQSQCGISPASARQWHGWSTKYQWFNRAAEHDSDLASRRRERMAKEFERAQDDAAVLIRSTLAKVAERIQGMDPEELAAGQIPAALRTLIELELKVLGYEDRVALTGKDGGPVKTEITGKDGGPVETQHVFQPSPELWDEVLRDRAEFERLRDGGTDEDTSESL